ncbi:MAG: hypothetical protein DI587_20675 [Variovorax paradoxus]|jgi:hypothetical protein|nr:MAG: hypothetical protein DI583_20675 [Variovorax paradoxus]PZQ07176.1 MAG: hypothetical protein DI587_20675 [Variovorax paradoxus]
MSAARTTLGLWLLLQLLLGGLQQAVAPAAQGERAAAQWRDGSAGHERADALVEHQRVQRTTTPSAEDMLVGPGAPTPHPTSPQAQPAPAAPGRAAALVLAAYRARAPPPAA